MSGINKDWLAFVNAHGTATLFNDQMESIAIQRAGLSNVPTDALKGYFGHTLGAAGVLETILSMKAVDDHTIIGTLGYEELGVSGKVNVSAEIALPTRILSSRCYQDLEDVMPLYWRVRNLLYLGKENIP